jgi:hypothetical protein
MTERLMPDDEWAEKFGWSEDEYGDQQVLGDSADIRMLLRRIGTEYVWSQQDRDDGGYEIVPGMTSQAHCYYLCDRARGPEDEDIVGTIPPSDNADDEDDDSIVIAIVDPED